jgi:BASS family bile acid:Na+ symporter
LALLIDTALRALTFLGKHGAAGFAISIFVGLSLPDLASTLRPFLPVSIFCFVTLSFARADFSGVARVVRQPARLATATAWAMLAMPVVITAVLAVIGRGSIDPGLLLGIALIAASPPLMGVPAYASLLGLDNSMAIALLVLTTAVTPFIAPPLASFVAGEAVPLDPFVLGLRLFGLLGGALIACLALRRLVGTAALTRWRHPLDGVNVIIYFVFAIAAMDGVIDATKADPARTAFYLLLGSGIAVGGLAVTMLVLGRRLGGADSFVLGLGTGMRNTGLLVSAMGAACPPNTYLFFALLQFPIYTAPLLVGPLARLILRRTPT